MCGQLAGPRPLCNHKKDPDLHCVAVSCQALVQVLRVHRLVGPDLAQHRTQRQLLQPTIYGVGSGIAADMRQMSTGRHDMRQQSTRRHPGGGGGQEHEPAICWSAMCTAVCTLQEANGCTNPNPPIRDRAGLGVGEGAVHTLTFGVMTACWTELWSNLTV